MEARLYTGKEPDAGRAGGSASVAVGHQRAWPMVERRRIAHERRLSEVRVRPHGAGCVAGNTATLLVCFMNRRMPNGTSGGVGGRREQSRLLPDCLRGYCAVGAGGVGSSIVEGVLRCARCRMRPGRMPRPKVASVVAASARPAAGLN